MKRLLVAALLTVSVALYAADKTKTVTLSVSGMTCESCAGTVEKALKKMEGVQKVSVNIKQKNAVVTLASASKTSAAALAKAVTDAGFTATESKGVKAGTVQKKMMDEGCGDGCCGDECGTEAKPAKAKKGDAKKS